MARLFLVLAAFLATASAFMAPASSVVGKQSTISMSTQFTDPFVQKMKKKNPATGSTKNLKGYTVGSRAPIVAKSSGTTQNGYKTNGDLRGVDKNTQNVPTATVLAIGALLYFGSSAVAGL